ncbi:MAG: hypothetical protein ACTSRA_02570 [Promethearchaeota archaeon]
MDYEETAENLIRQVMMKYDLSLEYQLFLDFLQHLSDFTGDFDEETNEEEKMRELIELMIKKNRAG